MQQRYVVPEVQATRLATMMQGGVPLVRDPYGRLGEALELSRAQVIDQLRAWDEDGLLREISAVLEGSALGHDSALVAGRVDPDDIDRVAAIINEHPTVTHNYMREHALNLWFTIATPPHMSLDETLRRLEALTGVDHFEALRRTYTFKIGVNFDLNSKANHTAAPTLGEAKSVTPSPREQAAFVALQTPLPYVEDPFAALVEGRDLTVDQLLEIASAHMGGAIRKYVATLRHRRLGVRGNGMGVWNVPEDQLARLGPWFAQTPEVSHCYARNAIPGFAYTLYTMIHASDEDTCRELAKGLAERAGIDDYTVLFSRKEYKKCRLRYFLPELDQWWQRTQAAPQEQL